MTKDDMSLGLAFRFRGSVQYHQGGGAGGAWQCQEGMELEVLRVLYLVPKVNRRGLASRQLGLEC